MYQLKKNIGSNKTSVGYDAGIRKYKVLKQI